jgi:hypothetical protein
MSAGPGVTLVTFLLSLQFLELAAWGAGGILIAARRFSWVPSVEMEH